MTWVLIEVVPFLVAAFVLGLLSGFAVWRWRRQSIDAEQWNELTSTTHRARAELELLEQQHRSLMGDRDGLTNRVKALEFELEAVREDLRSAHKQGSQYRAQRDSALTRVERVSTELSRMQERLVTAENSMSQARESIEEVIVLEAEAKQLKEELDLRNGRLTSLERSLVNSESENEQLAVHMADLQATLSELRTDLESESREADSLRKALEVAEHRVAELHPIAERVPELERTLDSARSDLDQSMARIAELDGLLASVRFEREAAQQRLAELDAEVFSARTELTKMDTLRNQLADVTADLARRDASVAELQAALADAQAVRNELTTAQATALELTAMLEQRADEADRQRTELHQSRRIIESQRAELANSDSLRTQLTDAHSRIAALDHELSERSDLARKARADLVSGHRRLAELELELAEMTARMLEVSDENDEAPTLRIELEAARTHIEKLESELAAIDGEHESHDLEHELDRLRSELAERSRRIEALEIAGSVVRVTAPVPEEHRGDVLSVVRGGGRHHDDLTVILGIGGRIAELLGDLGFSRWEHLARLDDEACSDLERQIDVPADVHPASWARQARQLVVRYPDESKRPDRRTYRSTTHKKDRVRGKL